VIRLRFGISILVWLILPASLSFGVAAASYESLFRSTPTNDFYDGMFVTITASIALVQIFLIYSQYIQLSSACSNTSQTHPIELASFSTTSSTTVTHLSSPTVTLSLYCHPLSSFFTFEFSILLALSVLNFVAGMVASGAVWTIACVGLFILHFKFYQWCIDDNQRGIKLIWVDALALSLCRRILLSVLYVLWGIGFIAFPVARPWDGRVAPFVRWFAYTVSGELVWRGIFASYALGFFVCTLDPFNRHSVFVLYVAVSGFLHACFMLTANLYSYYHSPQLPNGNREHLFGDIAGWFVISLFSAAILLGSSVCGFDKIDSNDLVDSESDSEVKVPLGFDENSSATCSTGQFKTQTFGSAKS
jgi:hypothetical protein